MNSKTEHPLLAYFGAQESKPLSAEEAQAADFETRINSIGRLLVKEVARIHRLLSPEGQVNYDQEDILLEIWAELRRRNDSFNCSRGNYRTFAALIIRNTFLDITCRARTVKLPADTASRLWKGDPENMARLKRAARDHWEINSGLLLPDCQPSPEDGLIWLETREEDQQRAAALLENCTVMECLALSTLGIWGDKPSTARQAAIRHGISPERLRKARKTAIKKLRKIAEEKD